MSSYLIYEIISYFGLLFIMLYLRRFFVVLGAESWFLLWVGLEINMIRFILLIYKKNTINVEVRLKYFFIQGIGSAMLLIILTLKSSYFREILILILRYKIGVGPFFFWFPNFCEGISWISCILVITLQKLIPFIFFRIFICFMIWVILLIRIIIGVLGCFNECNIKKFIAFSSIHYAGWIMLRTFIGRYLWILYLGGYLFIIFGVLLRIGHKNILNTRDFLNFKNPLLFFVRVINIGGMPPILGFFLKWWIFIYILNFRIEILWVVVIFSVLIFYIYCRLVFHLIIGYQFNYGFHSFINKSFMTTTYEYVYIGAIFLSPLMGWLII